MEVRNNSSYVSLEAIKGTIQALEDAIERASSIGDVVHLVRGVQTQALALTTSFKLATAMALDPGTSITLAGAKGTTIQLVCAFTPADASNQKVGYVSSDPTKATVDADTGLVTSVANGTTTITAISVDGGFTDTVAVTASGIS